MICEKHNIEMKNDHVESGLFFYCPQCVIEDGRLRPVPLSLSDKQELIEWKKLSASNGDSYYGYYKGLQVAYIMDVGLVDEFSVSFHDESPTHYLPSHAECKAVAEGFLETWLLRAELAKPSELCQNTLLAEIENILYGIDKDECGDPLGWWGTSTGADFGKGKLDLIRNLLK